MEHELKTDAKVFEAVKLGEKTFEIRKDDRAYAAQKYRLGLGGEPVDRLVLDELHRLKQNPEFSDSQSSEQR